MSDLSFGARLDAQLDERGSLCAGIDPHPGLLEAWGLSDDADGLAFEVFQFVDQLALLADHILALLDLHRAVLAAGSRLTGFADGREDKWSFDDSRDVTDIDEKLADKDIDPRQGGVGRTEPHHRHSDNADRRQNGDDTVVQPAETAEDSRAVDEQQQYVAVPQLAEFDGQLAVGVMMKWRIHML